MFSVQLLARFFSNSDKLIVPAQQTLFRVNLATKMFQYRDCDDGVFQRVMGFFHLFVDIVGLAVVELGGLVGMVLDLVGTKRLPQVFVSPRQCTDHWWRFEGGRQRSNLPLPPYHLIL